MMCGWTLGTLRFGNPLELYKHMVGYIHSPVIIHKYAILLLLFYTIVCLIDTSEISKVSLVNSANIHSWCH